MKLYVGGAYQGKLAYLYQKQNMKPEEIYFCNTEYPLLDLSKKAVSGLHLWVKAAADASLNPVTELLNRESEWQETIFLCDEIGMGIVPMGKDNRRWREETGRVLSLLSQKAEEVLLFAAGLYVRLK